MYQGHHFLLKSVMDANTVSVFTGSPTSTQKIH